MAGAAPGWPGSSQTSAPSPGEPPKVGQRAPGTVCTWQVGDVSVARFVPGPAGGTGVTFGSSYPAAITLFRGVRLAVAVAVDEATVDQATADPLADPDAQPGRAYVPGATGPPLGTDGEPWRVSADPGSEFQPGRALVYTSASVGDGFRDDHQVDESIVAVTGALSTRLAP